MAFTLSKKDRVVLTGLLAAFEGAKEALQEFCQERHDEWQEAYDGKSEKWQEGDAAETAMWNIEAIGAIADQLDELDMITDDLI